MEQTAGTQPAVSFSILRALRQNAHRRFLMRPRVPSLLVITLLIAITPLFAAPVASKYILLRPQRVFDAMSNDTHEGWTVLVSGEKIASVGPSLAIPPGTTPIELPGMTLLPGFTDSPSHALRHP